MLQIHNLTKVFNKDTVDEKRVFEDFSLTVNKGDFITIIGSNGAGKSTLLNLISGTIISDSGNIILNDNNISKLQEYKRTSKIGRVFQDPKKGTAPSLTIIENLSLAYNKGNKFGFKMCVSKKNIDYFKEALAQLSMGLEDRMDAKVGLLSGGQRQALSLIMATISNPTILLLDEPTAALDPKASERIVALVDEIINERKMTSMMVTHDLHQAITMGNRLLMLHRGQLLLDISGEKKKQLTIEKLLNYFEHSQGDDLISDRLLFS